MKYDADVRNAYKSFFGNIAGLLTKSGSSNLQALDKQEIDQEATIGSSKRGYYALRGSHHYYIYHNSILVWQKQPLFGFGLKSFRIKCWENLNNYILVSKKETIKLNKNTKKLLLACSNHPHNYYLEILTETGAVGLIIVSIIAFLFIVFLFRNYKFIKQISIENFILLSAIISLILETLPLRTTGSLFTTNNATYLILITSIILSYKKILKIKIE